MKTNFTKVCAAAIGTMLLAGTGLNVNAQITYPYVGNFETANTTVGPTATSNKAYASLDTVTMNGAKWIMGGVYLGSMTTGSDRFNGDRSARVRLTNNSTGSQGYLEMVSNLPNGAGVVSYKAGRYGTDNVDSIEVFYSINGGSSWTSVAVDPITDTALMTFNHTLNVAGNVRLKFQKKNAGSARVSFDDISVTSYSGTGTTVLFATAYTPTGSNVSLATDSLVVNFNQNLTAAAGSVKLYKVGSTTPVHTFLGTDAVITGSKAKFSPVTLENAASYYVTIDTNTFTYMTVGNTPVSNNTTWAFSTEDTVTPPPPTPLTSLDEKFLNCINTEMGVFVQYSEVGPNNTWRCSRFGRNKTNTNADSFAVYINGGSGAGVSVDNKDWLISKAPFDFSAMANPTLSFWQTRRYSGTATRKLMVSTDYVAGSNPATATWTEVSVPGLATVPTENTWTQISNVSLTTYKSTPFYLAFTYECGTTGTYELAYDDIKVENPTGIKTINGATLGVQVLGDATTNQINLNVEAKANDNIELQLFDLLGRKVATQKAAIQSGANRLSFTGLNLNAGMYVIRVISANGFGTVKAVVK